MNVWERYPKATWFENGEVPKAFPTDEYTMTYYRGRDRDDWKEMTFKAWSLDHALERATMDLCPDGWTVKIVQPTNTNV